MTGYINFDDYEYDEDEESHLFDYDPYDDSDLIDWREEWTGFSSISPIGFIPVLAISVSLIIGLVFFRFIFSQLPEIDFTSTALESRSVANPTGLIAPLFTPSVQYWETSILNWAAEWNLDPNLVATVMQIESCGNPDVVSSAGAMGLFQVMPFHFTADENGYDPETNAYRGMSYLTRSLNKFSGNVKMGLAGYNAGITGAGRGEALWPAETVRYATWGIGIYEDAKQGKSESATLNEWLSRAAGMCNAAKSRLGISP